MFTHNSIQNILISKENSYQNISWTIKIVFLLILDCHIGWIVCFRIYGN